MVWKQVCGLEASALEQYRDMHPDEYSELERAVNEKWGVLAVTLLHQCMSTSSLEGHQAASLLLAYNTCELFSESDRDVALTGLAGACIQQQTAQPQPGTQAADNTAALRPTPAPPASPLSCRDVLLWCWKHVPADTDIFARILAHFLPAGAGSHVLAAG